MKKKLPNPNEGIYSVVGAQFAAPALPVIKEIRNKDYMYYGEANLYPQKLIELYDSSAIHHTAAQAVKDGIFGEGIELIGDEYINTDGETIDEIFEKITLDYTLFNGYALNVVWNREGTAIAEVYHLPFANVRSGKKDEEDEVVEYYYSSDWSNLRKYKEIPYRAFDVTDNKGESASQIYYCFNYTPGNDVYPLPTYVAATNDITLDQKISRFHVNNISNGLAPSLFIKMRNGIPTPEARRDIYREIEETFAGEESAGRFFLSFTDSDTAPEIEPIDAANSDYYVTLEERISTRILTAWRITSPALLGIANGSGFSSVADEIKVAYAHFEGTVVEPKRKKITNSFGYILKLAGYNVKIEVIPNRIIEDAVEDLPDVEKEIIEKE
ncbi:MAG: phage portal protein [Candidatus Scalindua sp.]|nr:phage portal protein [Gammaproteobacteria bacterium]MCP4252998.1 phage portal protein [Candidatus Scalindua sp.]